MVTTLVRVCGQSLPWRASKLVNLHCSVRCAPMPHALLKSCLMIKSRQGGSKVGHSSPSSVRRSSRGTHHIHAPLFVASTRSITLTPHKPRQLPPLFNAADTGRLGLTTCPKSLGARLSSLGSCAARKIRSRTTWTSPACSSRPTVFRCESRSPQTSETTLVCSANRGVSSSTSQAVFSKRQQRQYRTQHHHHLTNSDVCEHCSALCHLVPLVQT
jgi:hypothetical protein